VSEFNRIAISGKICSGKTTVAEMLKNELGYTRMFFANELKVLCTDISNYNKFMVSMTSIPPVGNGASIMMDKIIEDIHRITTGDEEFYKAYQLVLGLIQQYKHVTNYNMDADKKDNAAREMLQIVANVLRDQVNSNIWCNSALLKMNELQSVCGFDKFVVDDLRYPNEFELLHQNGFVLVRLNISEAVQDKYVKKLYGKMDESRLTHISETALDNMTFDYVVDADQELDSMLDEVSKIVSGG